jgi:hypothetical protein
LKKNKKQNITLSVIAIVIIGAIIGYNYSVEQIKQKGLEFGNNLQKIQQEVKQIQIELNSKIIQWQEGDLAKEELLEYAEVHFQKLENTIKKYDELTPPEMFSASVELFKMSTQSQLESDKEFLKWIKNNQESSKIRSDSLLQESFEFEMMALGEFNAAKAGIKDEDEGKFEAPKADFSGKVIKIWQSMKEKCHMTYQTEQTSNHSNELERCLDEADMWKNDHLQ